jgi:hypothetical protein
MSGILDTMGITNSIYVSPNFTNPYYQRVFSSANTIYSGEDGLRVGPIDLDGLCFFSPERIIELLELHLNSLDMHRDIVPDLEYFEETTMSIAFPCDSRLVRCMGAWCEVVIFECSLGYSLALNPGAFIRIPKGYVF